MLARHYRHLFGCAAAFTFAFGSATSAEALVINIYGFGDLEEGTAAYRGVKAAARFWESVLTDDVSIDLSIGLVSSGLDKDVLGSARSFGGAKTQADWRAALIADATTPLDAIATANLATFSNSNVQLNYALQKALGLYTTGLSVDALIRLNSAYDFDFDTRDGFQSVSTDFVGVVVHEMGHALGFGSSVAQSTTLDSRPGNTDMFRYKDGGWDITWGGKPYFSIDGGKNPLFGNSYFTPGTDGNQPSHWLDSERIHDGVNCTQLLAPQIGVMDPTGGNCQLSIVTANDLAVFDAIGWDVNIDLLTNSGWSMSTAQIMGKFGAVPEPSTWAMMIFGFGAVGAAMRRRPRVAVRFA